VNHCNMAAVDGSMFSCASKTKLFPPQKHTNLLERHRDVGWRCNKAAHGTFVA